MIERLLKVSINPDLIDKQPPADAKTFRDGFQNQELTLDQLAMLINLGCAYSYSFHSEKRKRENFAAADVISVDVDGGMTLEDALNHPIVKKYCSLVYTTPSHNIDNPRFRLLFVLPRTITQTDDIVAASRSLSARLSGDMNATDPARLFYGSKNSDPTFLNQAVTEDFLDDLLTDGRITPRSESIAYNARTAARVKDAFNGEMEIKLSDNRLVQASEINQTTSIYCPFHNDRNPSAFISINKNKNRYIHCSSCQKTWWEKGSNIDHYNFYDFEESLINLRDTRANREETAGTLVPFIDGFIWKSTNIQFQNNRYLKIRDLENGLTIIKSPKGSGKSTFLSQSLKKLKYKHSSLQDYEEETHQQDRDVSIYSGERILLIGHRQALIGELCKRLGLNCYLDDPLNENNNIRKNYYGVCLDSLWRVKDEFYDTIVIDESEQVLSHFLSDTIGEKRRKIFDNFSNLIGKAKRVVALDADISWISFLTLRALASQRIQKSKGVWYTKSNSVSIYVNQWTQDDRELDVFSSEHHLIADLKEAVVNNKRILISSNSKKKIQEIEKSIEALEKDLGETHRIPRMMITSNNSKQNTIQSFLKNIKEEILNYQVILSSPSMGTGIDITFDADAQEIDCVYGFFENQINTHFEIDQQLSRVRNPKSVKVWISPSRFNFETDISIVTADYLNQSLQDVVDENYSFKFDEDSLDIKRAFISMVSLIVAQQRASKNNLKENFLEYRRRSGWNIKLIGKDDQLRLEGKAFRKIGVDLNLEHRKQDLLNAQTMNRISYERFKELLDSNDSNQNPELYLSFIRTSIELFFQSKITGELIEHYNDGKLRKKIDLLLPSVKPSEHISNTAIYRLNAKDEFKNLIRSKLDSSITIRALLASTPFFEPVSTPESTWSFEHQGKIFKVDIGDQLKVNPLIEFSTVDLDLFTSVSRYLEGEVLTQLGVNTQKDMESKPTQHLGKILNCVGLKVSKIRTKKVNGKKVYFYRLDDESTKLALELVNYRVLPDEDKWEFLNELYNFKYSAIEEQILLERQNRINQDFPLPSF